MIMKGEYDTKTNSMEYRDSSGAKVAQLVKKSSPFMESED
jgi:hypothetical protein